MSRGRDVPPQPREDARAERDATHRLPSRSGRTWSPSRGLTLPRSPERQTLPRERNRIALRDTEVDLLSTVGAFRAVAVRDLQTHRDPKAGRAGTRTDADVRSLREQGLLQAHTVSMNGQREPVAILTKAGRELLERWRAESPDARDGSEQRFYAGLVRPRELAHDAQLYRMFEAERTQLERGGATVTRVVLDYELKAEYHTYVHEREQAGMDATKARRAFAEEHQLPFVGGHIVFPDLRVEYETEDGRHEHRDLELATEHYSRARIAGKQSAGFRVYRAAGAHAGGGSKRGGHPADPHHLQWLG